MNDTCRRCGVEFEPKTPYAYDHLKKESITIHQGCWAAEKREETKKWMIVNE